MSSPDAHSPLRTQKTLLWLIASAFFMQMLDATIVNAAAPSIALALHVPPLSLRTALTSYVLTLAVFIPASAWLTERFGTQRIFAAAITVFTIGSLACGLAPNLRMLIIARVFQGLGGAMLMPVGRYVLLRVFGRKDFVAAMSFVAIPGLLGPALGPLLGGALAEYASWRLIFLINIPVGLVGLWLNRRAMPRLFGKRQPFDMRGFVLFGLASGMLLTSAEFAGDLHIGPSLVSAAVGIVIALLYALHSRSCSHPVNDLRLFRIRSFTIAVMGSLVARLGVAGLSFLLVLYLQIGCGYSPFASGLMLVPLALAMMLMKPFIERLIRKLGYRLLLRVTTPLVGVILASFALLGHAPSPWAVGALVFSYGLVLSLQYTTMNTLSFTDLAPAQAAHAAALTTTVQYLALSFGIANASMLMAVFIGPARQPEAYVPAFRMAVLILAMFPLIATLVFLRLRHDRPMRTPIETPDTAA